ncbi:cytochrome protein [Xylaria sp. FL1777]|nr:cytochrome protein [Xylaria sp. FL1777]
METAATLLRGSLLVVLLLVGVVLIPTARKTKRGPLPPGPKGWPVVGNVKDLPQGGVREWEHWLKHKDLYGPISSVTAMGTTIILLHSHELTSELFEKRSANYSSRTRLVFGGEMAGWGNITGILKYDRHFRAQRKAVHTIMGTPSLSSAYLPLQEAEVHRFLFRVLDKPEDLVQHIRTEAGAIILKMVYGYSTGSKTSDPLVKLADTAVEQFSIATMPGRWLVDVIPILRHLPEWMPGTSFKKTAREYRAKMTTMLEAPWEFAKNRRARGNFEQSYVNDFYWSKGGTLSPKDEYDLKWTALSVYGGGADTTVSTISSFWLAMTLYPEVQRKAQEEIDRVVGTGRLPSYNDRENLPYINAIVDEAWRFHPVIPMGVAHASSEDDVVEYDGKTYFIPKDSVILANLWWFTHDPKHYPDPMRFDPERYIAPNKAPDPRDYVFGYGRRICPGRHFAEFTVWITIAQTLAVFDISKGRDTDGHEIENKVLFTSGITTHPLPFKATIKPRSSQHEALIREVETLHPWEKSDAEEVESIMTRYPS